MPQSHPTMAVAATKLPKERLAQLDRIAARRRVSRSTLLRQMIEDLLAQEDEPLTPLEEASLRQRERDAHALRRLVAVGQRLAAR